MTKQISLSDIKAENVAGRDIIDQSSSTYIIESRKPSYMESLILRLKEEQENNRTCQEKLEDLTHYATRVEREELIGLENKLKAGHREEMLPFARATKEGILKKIKKYEHFESAQEIYACILSEIYSNFVLHVYPAIKAGKPESEVNLIIDKLVIKPVQDILGENILRILKADINGMIFFLTDNCHLKWD